ncbi:MAG: AAA family ATPase [Acetobacterium sp.]
MKPMLLKIKGINSFIEEQTIDFDELTKGGLFGIFGPTGSGKSTILDGITLALYGKLSRNSTNYINLNEQKGSVAFEFIISGAEHKNYRVSREFVRNKNGGINQGKCQLLDLSTGLAHVLADRATEVSRCCEDIIGLSLTDFTRTVVLPQGKFSDFLKLEGKPRREMLERLFNLSKYGEDLTNRVKFERIKTTEGLHRLEGRLKGYEEVSDQTLAEKKSEYTGIKKNLKVQEKALKAIAIELSEAQRLWEVKQELSRAREDERDLKNKESAIKSKESQLEQGKKALNVMPAIKAWESLTREISELEEKLGSDNDSHQKLLVEKVGLEKDWEQAEDEKINQHPKISDQLSKIIDAIGLKKEEITLDKQINDLIAVYNACDEKYQLFENEKKIVTAKLNSKKATIIADEIQEKNLWVAVDYREKVSQGSGFSEKINELASAIKINEDCLDKNSREIRNLIQEISLLNEKKENFQAKITDYAEKLRSHSDNQPTTREAIQKLKDETNRISNLLDKQKSFKERINKQNLRIAELEEKIEQKNRGRSNLLEEYENLQKTVKSLQNKNREAKLREQLIAGEACPVCGSKEHPIEGQPRLSDNSEELKDLENDQMLKENKLSNLNSEISELTGSLNAETDNQLVQKKELENLGEDIKEGTPEFLANQQTLLSQAIEAWEMQKKEWEESKNNCDHDLLSVIGDIREKNAELKSLETQTRQVDEQNRHKKAALKMLTADLEKLAAETKIIDFAHENLRLIEMDTRRNELGLSLEKWRKAFDDDQKQYNEMSEKIIELKDRMAEAKTSGHEKKKQLSEKKISMRAKVGADHDLAGLSSLQKKCEEDLKRINKNWLDCKQKRVSIQNDFERVQERVIKQEAVLKTLQGQYQNAEKFLKGQLNTLGFDDCQEVKMASLSLAIMDDLQLFIKHYYEALSKNKGLLEDLNKKINFRELNAEQLAEIGTFFEGYTENVERLKKQENQRDAEVQILEIRLVELREFLTEKEKIDHHLALITDLEKLFSGKKFVEFVAVERLKYISIEASKRLTEISNGNYGLEADADGRFIIRDYKNGGASRDPSTLSGGETFLASLALALALSAEIQLKGRAPLEFFFLDEGFGSLHEDALEDVMNSIEGLHHDKLKVGIISHVESIKNRMPVKLLITPAEAGAGGSRVRIEK